MRIVSTMLILLMTMIGFAQTGGPYDLRHAVIASGGGTQSVQGIYAIGGTAGQSVAGVQSAAGTFELRGGFWATEAFVPTAATVSISGRVMTANGYGISNAKVILTEANGTRRIATTATFGYFMFDAVLVGQTYIVEVQSGRYLFAEPARTISVVDEITELDFVAESQW